MKTIYLFVIFFVKIPLFSASVISYEPPDSIESSSCDVDFDISYLSFFELFFKSSANTTTSENCYWDFGDSTTSVMYNPVHKYQYPGVKTIYHTIITEDTFCTEFKTVYIGNKSCYAGFTIERDSIFLDNNESGYYFTFTDASIGNIISREWDFGDGNTSNDKIPSHQYDSRGTYPVRLTIYTNDGCTDTYSDTLVIRTGNWKSNSCVAKYIPVKLDTNKYGFVNYSTGTNIEYWDFGDSTFSTETNPIHVFDNQGEYIVSLTTISNDGCIDYRDSTIAISNNSNSYISFTYSIDDSSPDIVQFFIDSMDIAEEITTITWNFGDGEYSNETEPVHKYKVLESYSVKLIVEVDSGNTIKYSRTINLIKDAFGIKTVSIIAESDKVVYINYTDISVEIPSYYSKIENADGYWTVVEGDAKIETPDSTTTRVLSLSNGSNIFRWTYSVGDLVNSDEIEVTYTIPEVEYNVVANTDNVYEFFDISLGAVGWLWDFGDGNTSEESSVEHSYEDSGVYEICLTIYLEDNSTIESCESMFMESVQSTSYTVTGAVHASNETANSCAVLFLKLYDDYYRAIELNTLTDGTFETSLPEGEYFIYAIPDPNTYADYMPTYYGDVTSWTDAYSISVTANTYDIDIHLEETPEEPAGTGEITGYVVYEDVLSYEESIYGIQWFDNVNVKSGRKLTLTNAARNIPVFLYNSDDNIVSWTLSDEDGYFEFTYLENNTYYVENEKAGFTLSVVTSIEVTDEKKTYNGVEIVLRSEDIIVSINDDEIVSDLSATFYPNPVSDYLFLDVSELSNQEISIEIFNISGQIVMNQQLESFDSNSCVKLNLSGLNQGLYILKITPVSSSVRSGLLIKE